MRHLSVRFEVRLGFLLDGLRRYINGYSAHARPIQRKYADPSGRLRTNELTARATDSFDSCVIVGSLYFGGEQATVSTFQVLRLNRPLGSQPAKRRHREINRIDVGRCDVMLPEMESTSRTGAEPLSVGAK